VNKTRLLQLERQSRHYAPVRSRVKVRENERGALAITYHGRPPRFSEIAAQRVPVPSANHPWKRSYKQMPTPIQKAI
jgi:hypothetical protein